MKTRITKDLYDIAQRVREIDKGYYPVYNKRFKRFEIHREGTPSLILTAEKLDARIIERLMRQRYKSVFDIAREVEEHNERSDHKKSKELEREVERCLSRLNK